MTVNINICRPRRLMPEKQWSLNSNLRRSEKHKKLPRLRHLGDIFDSIGWS